MSAVKEHQDVIIIVLILMEAIIVLAWMDMNWNQIITLVQVMNTYRDKLMSCHEIFGPGT